MKAVLRIFVLSGVLFALSACHLGIFHVPPGQIKKQNTPAATGTAPGQAKKKP